MGAERHPLLDVADEVLRGRVPSTADVGDRARRLAAFVHDAAPVLAAIAATNPIGVIEYEGGWSEVTPGLGAMEGCRFCLSTSATTVGGHEAACVWIRARALLARHREG